MAAVKKGYKAAKCQKCEEVVSILVRIQAWNGEDWFDADICPKCLFEKATELYEPYE